MNNWGYVHVRYLGNILKGLIINFVKLDFLKLNFKT